MREQVKVAEKSDVPWILEQLKEFSVFFGTRKSLYDEDYAPTGLLHFMDVGIVLVAVRGDEHLGFILGAITPHLFNPKVRVLTEMFWWVDTKHRRSRAGYLLFREFMKWGKENVDWIMFSLEEKSPVNEGTLLNRGFRRIERSYLIEMG